MRECKHAYCEIVYTKENNVIIDTNYQCIKCGKIISSEKYQEIKTFFCDECEGTGLIDMGFGEHWYCTACKVGE